MSQPETDVSRPQCPNLISRHSRFSLHAICIVSTVCDILGPKLIKKGINLKMEGTVSSPECPSTQSPVSINVETTVASNRALNVIDGKFKANVSNAVFGRQGVQA